VDVIISAPQKVWTGPACVALIMLSERAADRMASTQETSFSMSLKRWCAIMDTYDHHADRWFARLSRDQC
jgi:aspartate aminotransferase-like enzyme